jgi:hypothetical protein
MPTLNAPRKGLRKAATLMCKDCIYDSTVGGTWREQVAECPVLRCPLWPFRPLPTSGPLANAPRVADTMPREWQSMPIGTAFPQPPFAKQYPPLGAPVGVGAAPPTEPRMPTPIARAEYAP